MTDRLLIVPVGSWEQHGPHLPFDTDTRIASELSRRLCEAAATWPEFEPTLGPALTVAASGEHAGFVGTLSIGTDVTTAVIVELMRSATWAARVVFVNGHGGNHDAITQAAEVARREGRRVLFWSPPGDDERDTHAGRIETSVMMSIAPDAVRYDRLEVGNDEPISVLLPRLRRDGVAAVSPNGILGDPRRADAGAGEELLDRWMTDLVRTVDTWCKTS
ncbi:MAG: mycofactocin biosynthesis peptidyl-dipeptidase MftE [Ilumatobacteraceae bacterium]